MLSLLVGVNDTEQALRQKDAGATTRFEEGYRALLDRTKASLPGCTLVLCESFIAPVGRVKEGWEAWQREMGPKQETLRRLAKDYGVLFVPLQKVFTDDASRAPAGYWIWDGIHPTVASPELIAREWMKVAGKPFPF